MPLGVLPVACAPSPRRASAGVFRSYSYGVNDSPVDRSFVVLQAFGFRTLRSSSFMFGAFSGFFELAHVEFVVESLSPQEFFMGPTLDYLSLVYHQDLV